MSMRDLIPWGRHGSTAPIPYEQPQNPMAGFRREMDRLFDDLFRGSLPSLNPRFGQSFTAWPNVELGETDREVRVSVEVPGMGKDDMEILTEDGVLTIRGEKKCETDDKERGYSERTYGRFERRIALPANVDEQGAQAAFRDGVLTVTFPKSGEVERGRRIPINAETKH